MNILTNFSNSTTSKKCWSCDSDYLIPQEDKHNFIERYEVFKCGICGRLSRWDFDWEKRNKLAISIFRNYEDFLNDFEKSFLKNISRFNCLSEKQEKAFKKIKKKYEVLRC